MDPSEKAANGPKNIIVCCDGTWCGDSVDTRPTNMKIIANQFAGQAVHDGERVLHNTNTVRYFSGVGVNVPNGLWIEKAIDGSLAVSIKDRCVDAYRFIVEEYTLGDRIWLFGHSRGAFTVRCVAGMINNCGIFDTTKPYDPEVGDVQEACKTVYAMYRNQQDAPNSADAVAWREKYSYERTPDPPIRFMGLLDTVGALGVPKLDPGRRVQYEFYDTHVSSEVQQVFQALSLDDQLAFFTPCRVDMWAQGQNSHYPATQFVREEIWFPGAHIDIGRQNWVLDSVVDGALNEVILPKFVYLRGLANPPLFAMLDKVREADAHIIPANGALIGEAQNALPDVKWDMDLPLSWRLCGWLGLGLFKPYHSAVTRVDAADRDSTGIIKDQQSYRGVYASYLADVTTAAHWTGALLGRKLPLIGLLPSLLLSPVDAILFFAKEQLIADRDVPLDAVLSYLP